MPDRRLIVGEFDPNDEDSGKLFGLQPNDAAGIAIPAFRYGPIRPAVGSVAGQAFIETASKIASVWDGNQWTQIAVPVIVPYTTENDLFQATPNDGTVAFAEDTGNLFTRTNGAWLNVGNRQYPTEVGMLADTPPTGTVGFALDTRMFAVRTGAGWALMAQQTVTLADIAPTTPVAGQQWYDTINNVLFVYDGTIWRPPESSTPTGTIIMYSSWDPPVGHLRCDGSAIPAGAQYDALKQLIGNNTPDLRDQFIRMANTQAEVGFAKQNDTTRRPRQHDFTGSAANAGAHEHHMTLWAYGTSGSWTDSREVLISRHGSAWSPSHDEGPGWNTDSAGAHSHTVNITGGGDTETAPKHVRLCFHVKAF